MEKANDFLKELCECMEKQNEVPTYYIPKVHPAASLDAYMKEQYFSILFKSLKETLEETVDIQKTAISYILNLSNKANFKIVPHEITKYVFMLDDKKMQDCMISFRDEEIRYLLGFELYILSMILMDQKDSSYCKKVLTGLELTKGDIICYQEIEKVIRTKNLSGYSQKEYYKHRHIISGYLDNLDFSSERYLLHANFPASKDRSLGGLFDFIAVVCPGLAFTWKKVDDFVYVEKGELVSQFDSNQSETLHAQNCTQIIAEKAGIILFMHVKDNSGKEVFISKWCDNGEVFGIIFHPLDDKKSVSTYLANAVSKNKGLTTFTLGI